ncbi:MAG: integrase arm-type DNA-binding domain-containing protein, partial [Alphaproteobacteria bacterium]|nr:integrase arm-type DNA-binding domain-containing protein [Alphaproteobacteria bacterium]
MAAVKLTETGVKNLKPTSDKREEIPDALLPGLYLIVQPSGVKSWAVRYRRAGKPSKYTLGKYPVLKLGDAREQARDVLNMAAKGDDPSAEKRRAKEAPSDAVEDVVEDYIKRYVEVNTKPRSAVETNRALRQRVVPEWRGRSIRDITRRDIIDLLEDIAAEAPATANRTKATISSLFNWCLDREILDTSPAVRLKAPAPIVERERVLSDDEIKALWPAFSKQGEPIDAYFKILLLTGQRRSEVATMKWEHLDLKNGLWTIPGALTKSGREHEVPLSPLAVEILSGVIKIGTHVFAARADRPISGFSK